MKEELEGEIWKDIPGYIGLYQISNKGRVKSLPKEWIGGKGCVRKHNGIIMKTGVDKKGFHKIKLHKDKKIKSTSVSILMAMSFLSHVPKKGIVVDHKDNNPSNNNLENLQIITHRLNTSKDSKNATSKYVGVNWDKSMKKWLSRIQISGKNIGLGYFDDEFKASLTYKKALLNLHLFNGDVNLFKEKLKEII